MKKDQLNRVKDTTTNPINKTHRFSSIVIPQFKNVREAKEFIKIQSETVSYLEKNLSDYKRFLESSREHADFWKEQCEECEETIKRLEMGNIDDSAYEQLKESIKEKGARIDELEKEIRKLKNELKKDTPYTYLDFIMN